MKVRCEEKDVFEKLKDVNLQYEKILGEKLQLNMSRGKPAPEQLDESNQLLKELKTYTMNNGEDGRNYGESDGILECRKLFGDLLGLELKHMVLGGNSSLNLMFDTMAFLCLFGTENSKPWQYYKFEGTPVKFLCPSPGYDRHFKICEELGIEMITVPMNSDGPDMDVVKELVKNDPLIKGMWCVPLHSNPEGICYSDSVVEEIASMETAATDFRVFWDNAYGIHHIYEKVELMNILDACKKYDNPNRAYYFFSTSKITFAGGGIALIASGEDGIKEWKKHMSAQTISYDKINQLRHLQMFESSKHIKDHMDILAELLKPKFDKVICKLEKSFGKNKYASWTTPKGGYFISLYTQEGCAKRTVELAKQAGVVLTDAGATYPYGIDEKDSNIRIAPSYPTLEELNKAMDILIVCIEKATLENIIKNKAGEIIK